MTPRAVYDVDPRSGDRTLVKRQPVLGDFDAAAVESREWVPAADGVDIPVSVVRRRDITPDGSAPACSPAMAPMRSPTTLFLRVAPVEPARPRCRCCRRTRARRRGDGPGVVRPGQTRPQGHDLHRLRFRRGRPARSLGSTRLDWAVRAGRARGPADRRGPRQRARSVPGGDRQGPLVDALTSMLDPDLPLSRRGSGRSGATRWGTPRHTAGWRLMRLTTMSARRPIPRSSPRRPSTTPRVLVTEPAKWVARLRTLATNDPAARPILLHTEMTAGHGGRSGRYDAWREIAWDWAFPPGSPRRSRRLRGGQPNSRGRGSIQPARSTGAPRRSCARRAQNRPRR